MLKTLRVERGAETVVPQSSDELAAPTDNEHLQLTKVVSV